MGQLTIRFDLLSFACVLVGVGFLFGIDSLSDGELVGMIIAVLLLLIVEAMELLFFWGENK